MARNSVNDYSQTPSNNTDIQSININEGCAPSGINNAIRALMAHVGAFAQGGVTATAVLVATLGAGTATAGTLTVGTATATSLAVSTLYVGGETVTEVARDAYANQAQAEGGTATGTVMDPLRTKQAVAALVPNASTATPGKVEKATPAEVVAETADVYPDAATLKSHPGVAKASVTFQTNGTIDKAYNVASITDHGTGDWTVNFTNAMADALYQAQVTVDSDGSSGNMDRIGISVLRQTGSVRVRVVSSSGTVNESNVDRIMVTVFGDLA